MHSDLPPMRNEQRKSPKSATIPFAAFAKIFFAEKLTKERKGRREARWCVFQLENVVEPSCFPSASPSRLLGKRQFKKTTGFIGLICAHEALGSPVPPKADMCGATSDVR
jgi:hypothetical protein